MGAAVALVIQAGVDVPAGTGGRPAPVLLAAALAAGVALAVAGVGDVRGQAEQLTGVLAVPPLVHGVVERVLGALRFLLAVVGADGQHGPRAV